MVDIFKPRTEPAVSIYNAYQTEATKRRGRRALDWIQTEREAVFHTAVTLAQQMGLRAPTIEEVIDAERSALGHIDYGSKWALRVAAIMQIPKTTGDGND